MDEFAKLVANRKKHAKQKQDRTVKLGDIVSKLVDEKIEPKQKKYESITHQWKQLLPDGLQSHCKIIDISGGQIKVAVDSPSYMHELRLCNSLLVAELQHRCPRARIERIKITIA